MSALLAAEHLVTAVGHKGARGPGRRDGPLRAVDDVTFELAEGKALGLVGESGTGKTTLARTVVRLAEPSQGRLLFRGQDVAHARRHALGPLRAEVQIVFQDSQGALNPRRTVGQSVSMPLRVRGEGGDRGRRTAQALERVGLAATIASRHPHELSGGERQRVGIARALAGDPRLLVLDEPVSALDVSVQAQILNLLVDLREQLSLSYLMVAHDIGVVRHCCDRIAVMYLGKIVEVAAATRIAARPTHPYTQALIEAVPAPDPAVRRRPSPAPTTVATQPPAGGCAFRDRCPRAVGICRTAEPPLTELSDGTLTACHRPPNVTGVDLRDASVSRASPLSAGRELPSVA